MSLGQYNRRVTLLRATVARVAGRATTTYADAFTGIPARIEPLSTREYTASGAAQGRVSARIVLLGDWAALVDRTMRVRDDRGIGYSIEGPPLPDAKTGAEYVTLLCLQGGEGS